MTAPAPGIFSPLRITTLLVSLLAALASGTNYVISAYAPQLGSKLRLSHTQLNFVALAGNSGVYFSAPVWGKLVDARGPRPLLALACVFLLAGYSGIRGMFDLGLDDGEKLSKLHLGLLLFCSFLTGAGGSAGICGAINPAAKNFPDKLRATAVAIVISGFGLSAFLFSSISHILFPGNTSEFLLVLALGTSIPMVIGFFVIRTIPLPSQDATHVFEHASSVAYEPLSASADHFHHMNNSNTHLLSHDEDDEDDIMRPDLHQYPREAGDSPATVLAAVELSPSVSVDGLRNMSRSRSRSVAASHRLRSHEKHLEGHHLDISGRALWMTLDFWILFTMNILLAGTGLMYINNVGSISQALFAKNNPDFDEAQSTTWQATQVSTISIMNFSGRLLIGVIADLTKSRLHYPRSFCCMLVTSMFVLSQIITLTMDDVRQLWKASAMLGFAYGSLFGLLPTVTIEWFGLHHFSENWGYLSLAPVVGGNLFSLAFGRNLDAHDSPEASSDVLALSSESTTSTNLTDSIRRAALPSQGPQCFEGRDCYVASLYLTLGACIVAFGLSVWAAWRDRKERGHPLAPVDEVEVWRETIPEE